MVAISETFEWSAYTLVQTCTCMRFCRKKRRFIAFYNLVFLQLWRYKKQ